VRRLLLLEATMLAGISLGLGTVIAGFAVVPLAVAVGTILPYGPVRIYLATATGGLMITLLVTAVVARVATRQRPIHTAARAVWI
jgi:putative ABC transport system permease protein